MARRSDRRRWVAPEVPHACTTALTHTCRASRRSQAALEPACHWVKQVVALVCGVAFGLMPLLGMQAMLSFMAITLATTWVTYSFVLKADLGLPGFEGQLDLMKEGATAAFGIFLLSWIVSYTLVHGSPPLPLQAEDSESKT